MALIVFDTNIFIDMLHGVHEATVELGSYDNPAISVITYMELRAGEAARSQASAQVHGAALVTRNAKDFIGAPVSVYIPYDYDSLTGIVSNVKAPHH